jgi:hypothetical protein
VHIIELGGFVSLEQRYPHLSPSKINYDRPRHEPTVEEAEAAAVRQEAYDTHAVARQAANIPRPRFSAEEVAAMRASAAENAAAAVSHAPADIAGLLERVTALEAANAALRSELDAVQSMAHS